MPDIDLSDKVDTYYGEYSIEHWIKMLLNGEIVLPPYQRAFVWKPKQALGLLHSLKHGYFIPPVTIAYGSNEFPVKNKNNKQNLLLDGQQRLTSLLMLYLGFWFKEDKNQSEQENSLRAEETDSGDGEEIEEITVYQLQSFSLIQKEYQNCENIEDLKERLAENNAFKKIEEALELEDKKQYSDLEGKISKIFSDCFLGYSYMRLGNDISENDEKKFYSEIFRSINMKGVTLTITENRAALYWLAPDKKDFLNPEFAENYTISGESYDFIRCLAFLAAYCKKGREYVARGYRNGGQKPYTKYFDEYVLYIVGENNSETRFSPCPGDWKKRIEHLEYVLKSALEARHIFNNISDADYAFFGLTYWVLFQGKKLKPNFELGLGKVLKGDAVAKLQLNKDEEIRYRDNPNVIGRIRRRLQAAIDDLEWLFL